MTDYRNLLEVWIENCEQRGIDLTIKPSERLGWKAVHADLTSHGGFQWPGPGGKVTSRGATKGGPCPSREGDGYCIAKTAEGASSGGIPLHTVLVLAYPKSSVLGEDAHKIRVRSARVMAVVDGWRANLRGADLWRANLRGANLRGADLRGADLWRANLRGADLWGADLRGANLRGADLWRADLRGANLRGADLWRANLRRAFGTSSCGRIVDGSLVSPDPWL